MLGTIARLFRFRDLKESKKLSRDTARRPAHRQRTVKLHLEELEPRTVPAVPFAANFLASLDGISIASLPGGALDITSTTDLNNFPPSGDIYVQTTNGVATLKYTSTGTNPNTNNPAFLGVTLDSASSFATSTGATDTSGTLYSIHPAIFEASPTANLTPFHFTFTDNMQLTGGSTPPDVISYAVAWNSVPLPGGSPVSYYLPSANGAYAQASSGSGNLPFFSLTSAGSTTITLPFIPTNSCNIFIAVGTPPTIPLSGLSPPTPPSSYYDIVEFTLDASGVNNAVPPPLEHLPTLNIDTSQVTQFGMPLTVTGTTTTGSAISVGVTPSVDRADFFTAYTNFVNATAPGAGATPSPYVSLIVNNGGNPPFGILNPSEYINQNPASSGQFATVFNTALVNLFEQQNANPPAPTLNLALTVGTDTWTGTATTVTAGAGPNQGTQYNVLKFTNATLGTVYVYEPFFSTNGGAPSGSNITTAPAPPSWLNSTSDSPGEMVFGNRDVFADAAIQIDPVTGAALTAAQSTALGNIENQLVAALNRGIADMNFSGNTTTAWQTGTNFYPTGHEANAYAAFMHSDSYPTGNPAVQGTDVFINKLSYGFGYDDQGGFASAFAYTIQNINQTGITVGIGPWVAAAASKVAFTSTPQTLTAGVASGTITITLEDASGNALPASSDVVVNLSSTSAGGSFQPVGGGSAITSVTIPTGSSTATFIYIDTNVGTPTLTATPPAGLTAATQQETVQAAASKVAFTSTPQTLTVGVASGTITITLEDASGNAVLAGGNVLVNLSSSSAGGSFQPLGGGSAITSVTIPAGSSTATFIYTDTNVGTPTLTATPPAGLTAATQQETVQPAGQASPLTSTVSVSPPSFVAGQTVTVTLQAKDALGNNLTTGGLTITFAVAAGSAGGTLGAVTDNQNGTYTADFVSSSAMGNSTITATMNSAPVTSTASTNAFFQSDFPGAGPLAAPWLKKAGAFTAANNAATVGKTAAIAVYNGTATANLSAEVTVSGIAKGRLAALVTRYTSNAAYYRAGILRTAAGDFLALIQRVSKSAGTLVVTTLAKKAVTFSDSGTITFEAVGPSLRLYLNGNLVVAAANPGFKSGSVGIFGSPGATFANFSARSVNLQNATLPFSDNFTPTSNGQLNTFWTDQLGNFTVQSGQAVASTDRVNQATVNGASTANALVSVTVGTLNARNQFAALAARYQDNGRKMYYAGVFNRSTTDTPDYFAEIFRIVNSVTKRLKSVHLESFAGGTTLTFKLTGNALELTVGGGGPTLNVNDTTIPAAGLVGIRGGVGAQFSAFDAQVPWRLMDVPDTSTGTLVLQGTRASLYGSRQNKHIDSCFGSSILGLHTD